MRWVGIAVVVLVAAVARADWMDHFAVREDVGVHKAPYLGRAELLVLPLEVAGFAPIDRAKLEAFFADDFAQLMKTTSLGRYAPHVTVGPTIHYSSCPLPQATAFDS